MGSAGVAAGRPASPSGSFRQGVTLGPARVGRTRGRRCDGSTSRFWWNATMHLNIRFLGCPRMNRCPHCNHAIAICLCVSIIAETSVSSAQDWCSLPAATSERAVGEAAKPDAEFPEVATTLPGMRQLSPDQLLPERALRDGFCKRLSSPHLLVSAPSASRCACRARRCRRRAR